MKLTIGNKLAIGIGVLLAQIAAVGFLAAFYVRGIHGSLAQVVQVDHPAIVAALDVEANLAGIGASVYGYVRERDPDHVERIKARRAALDEALAVLRALPLDDDGRRLVDELTTRSAGLSEKVERVLAEFAEREAALDRFEVARHELDLLIDLRIEAPLADVEGLSAKLRAAMEVEINVNGVGKAVGAFIESANARYERDFDVDVADVRAAFGQYQALASGPEVGPAREFEALFETLVADARAAFEKEKSVRAELRAFTKLRRDLQYGAVAGLRELSARSYKAAEQQALQSVVASSWVLFLGVLAAVFIGLLTGVVVSRSVTRPVNEVVGQLASVSSEIVAATAEQNAGAAEQASAVSQTVSNIEEMRQTSEQAAERAQQMMDKARESESTGERGQTALQDAVTSMRRVEQQSSAVASHIVALAERTQAIGEIIAAVTEMAEQSNLLALNAAIEASRAGEHGRGFAVVATEIKALADRSKKGTAQVRQILGDIQKATNAAVLSTEESTRAVNATIAVVGQAGEVLFSLAHAIEETATIAAQSAASARQQATGVVQVQQAMTAIDQVAKQGLVATRQVAASAQELGAMSGVLRAMVVTTAPTAADERG
jgi:methyl-accepting chemotaxis protein